MAPANTPAGAPERFLSAAHAHTPVLRPGGLHFASDLPGHVQTFSTDRPGAWPARLAAGTDRMLPVALAGGLGLVVRHDRGGNEAWQLSLLQPDGSLRRLTPDDGARHLVGPLSPDGTRLGLAYNPGGQVDFVLGALDVRSGRIEPWSSRPGAWLWSGWRGDGEEAAVVRTLAPTRSEAYLLGPGGSLRPLLPGAIRVEQPGWAGGRLLALTDHGGDFLHLVEIDPGDPARARPLFAPEGADVEAFVPNHRGERAVAVVNRGAYDELLMIDLASARVLHRLEPSGGAPGLLHRDNVSSLADQVAWSPADDRVFVAWETPTAPSDIFELPPDRPWTAAAAGAPVAHAHAPSEVAFTSFDGETINALHYRGGAAPRPTVVYFHGGPESQTRGGFNPVVQALVAAGLDVLMPNVRGSTGYGRRFHSIDDRELRWDSVRDGVEAGRWLKRQAPDVPVAAMGGSYGGFMTLAVLVEEPGLWDAAVDIVGIADWHTFFRNTSPWRRALRAAEYGDPDREPDATFLAEFSPLRRADAIRAPLLVIHGRNDVRVPLGEAEQIAAATGAELLVFDDEGHGIVRHGNRVRAYARALDFLRERLA